MLNKMAKKNISCSIYDKRLIIISYYISSYKFYKKKTNTKKEGWERTQVDHSKKLQMVDE